MFRKACSVVDSIFALPWLTKKTRECGVDLHVLFIYIKKARDSIYREYLMNCLTEFGIPKKLISPVRVFSMIQKASKSRESSHGELLRQHRAQTRRQCATDIFGPALEKIMMLAFNRKPEAFQVEDDKITHLASADDAILLSRPKKEMMTMSDSVEAAANKIDLLVTESKTEYLIIVFRTPVPQSNMPLQTFFAKDRTNLVTQTGWRSCAGGRPNSHIK
ncbi:uncharacterized protein LOC126260312 [Schistocerca nitens]|uniref:uncharacterized protein LOC126260312 n=1 Tax=Schistocerca nitens TaxID=7011 RepID=UPI002117E239|nr:uncharacterized protein LOC126260312 [Schistocerca nitens]